MLLVGLSVVITIIVLNVHYRKPSTHKMALWVRKIFIRRLPKLLLMRVPEQLLEDMASGTTINATMLRKSAAARNTSPPPPPLSQRDCNGLHGTSSATNRFSGLGAYNGLSSALDSHSDGSDLLLDGGGRRKYPFELEKAIHNVKFIQHHMQRQDEFDAVSYINLNILIQNISCHSVLNLRKFCFSNVKIRMMNQFFFCKTFHEFYIIYIF